MCRLLLWPSKTAYAVSCRPLDKMGGIAVTVSLTTSELMTCHHVTTSFHELRLNKHASNNEDGVPV